MSFWNNPSDALPKQQHRWVISLGDKNPNGTNDLQNTLPYYYAKNVDRPSYTIKTVQAKYLHAHTFNFPGRLTWNPITITFYDVLMTKSKTSFLMEPTVQTIEQLNQQQIINERIIQTTGLPEGIRNRQIFTNYDINFRQTTQLFFYRFLQDAGYFDPEEYDKEDQLLRFREYNFKQKMTKAIGSSGPDYIDNLTGIKTGKNGDSANFVNKYKQPTLTINDIDGSGQIIESWILYNPLISDVKFDKLDYTSDNVLTITARIEYDWAKLVPTQFTGQTSTDILEIPIFELPKMADVRSANISIAGGISEDQGRNLTFTENDLDYISGEKPTSVVRIEDPITREVRYERKIIGE